MTIPRILHRVVPESTDPEVEDFWRRLVDMHPGWIHHTWRQPHDNDAFELGDLFDRCSHGAQIADLVRLEALWKLGGIYVDSDCEPVRPLDPLLDHELVIGAVDGEYLANGVIGARPGHPGIRACMDLIRSERRVDLRVPPSEATGPTLATIVLGDRDDVTVLPPEFFYPYPFGAPRPASVWDVATPFTLLAHHWAHSWGEASSRASRVDVWRSQLRAGARTTFDRVAAALHARRVEVPISNGTFAGDDRLLTVRPNGHPFLAKASDRIDTPALVSGSAYRAPIHTFVQRVVRPGDRVADIAAATGLHAVAMAKIVGRFGRVFAHEADEDRRRLLVENVALNKAERQTVLVNSPELDEHLPLDLPLRLVHLGESASAADGLSGLQALLARSAVEMIVLTVGRRSAGSSWDRLRDLLRMLEDRHGAAPSILGHGGRTHPTSLDSLLAGAADRPAVLTLPHCRL